MTTVCRNLAGWKPPAGLRPWAWDPGWCFFGGYKNSALEPVGTPNNGGLFFNSDKYLVEGNLFVKRAEYLTLRGMNLKIGPRNGRFGFHEGSEFQNRLLGLKPAHAKRFYFSALAVHHEKANQRNPLFFSSLSGYDSIEAFPQKKPKSFWMSIGKLPGRLVLFLA
jgi:hypothetical protein